MSEGSGTTRRIALKLAAAAGATTAGAATFGGTAGAAKSSPITTEPGSITQDVKSKVTDATDGSNVGKFTGTLSIDEFGLTDSGDITTTGSLDGAVKTAGGATRQVSRTFEDVTTQLSSNGSCTILTLDLGPLDLEVLGLRVQLSEIHLDITGETGSGNLLGNLLCAIADIGSGGGLLSGLQGILEDLLGVVNDLIGSLSA